MNEVKYKKIALALENNIKNNIYSEKLPPIRSLIKEFCVGNPTMNKALKILVKKGLIIPSGPRGIIINRRRVIRPKTGIVAVFCHSDLMDVANDSMLKELRMRIEEDGCKALFMNVPDPNDFDDEKFWSSNWVDGYIFAYSTIEKELAYKLHNSGVPFVAANRLPAECGAHWVEFNIEKTLRIMVQTLINADRKRIFFAFSRMGMPSYVEYIKWSWNEIIDKYSKECSGFSFYFKGANYTEHDLECAKKFIEMQCDALIAIGPSPLDIEKELARAGLRSDKDYSLFYRNHRLEAPQEKFSYVLSPYKNLADEVWNLFKKVVKNPELEAQNILVDEDIHINEIIKRRNKLNVKSTVNSAYAMTEI